MNTVWLLLVMSGGAYNVGTVTSVEFSNRESCISARAAMKEQGWHKYSEFICVPKDGKAVGK